MSSRGQNFASCKERGKQGENLVYSWMRRSGWEVQDVRSDPTYQKRDIDYIASKDGKTRTLEVKNDTYIAKSGNVCLEIQVGDKPGWLQCIEAEFLLVVGQDLMVRIFRMTDIWRYLMSKETHRTHVNKDGDTLCLTYLLPIESIPHKTCALLPPDP
jgi:hypothetical protein